MYRLVIAPSAQREIKKFKKWTRHSISNIFEEIREDPLLGKPLSRNLTGKYTYKTGFFRVVYKVDTKDKVINIISAGHRSVVYN